MATVTEEPRIRDDAPLFEIVNGQIVELPPMGIYASRLAFRLGVFLHVHGQRHNLGEAVTEGLFRLSLPVSRNRRPDVAFVSYQRWPKGKAQSITDNAWDVVPELAVEVVSPHDLAEELIDKIDEYFRSGIKQVWVVYPSRLQVHVFESMTQIRVLERKDTLEGGSAVPEFSLALPELFLEEPAAA